MTSPSRLHTEARVQQRNKYNHTYILFTPYPAEYTGNLDLKINSIAQHMATHPKVLGLTLDPKLIYSTHIHNISVHTHKPLQIIKTLTATGWFGEETASHAKRSIETCQRMHARHKHTSSAHYPYTSTYISTPHYTNRKHNIPYTNI